VSEVPDPWIYPEMSIRACYIPVRSRVLHARRKRLATDIRTCVDGELLVLCVYRYECMRLDIRVYVYIYYVCIRMIYMCLYTCIYVRMHAFSFVRLYTCRYAYV
jgi:hypothetical protein